MIGALYLRLQLTSATVQRCPAGSTVVQDPPGPDHDHWSPRTRTHCINVCTAYVRRVTYSGIHGWAYMGIHGKQAAFRRVSCMVCGGERRKPPALSGCLWPYVAFCGSRWLFVALSGPLNPSPAHGIMQVPSKNMRYRGCSSDKYSTLC